METALMMRLAVFALSVIAGQYAAVASPVSVTGPNALALAAIIAQHSPMIRPYHQRVIARLFGGNTNFAFTPNGKILIRAESVFCRTSNVDITMRSCELTFGIGKRALTGRAANEVDATGVVAGASTEGAAGSIVESFSKLVCTIEPNEVMKKAGGGAECTFEVGQ
jgi:hypothetical protein